MKTKTINLLKSNRLINIVVFYFFCLILFSHKIYGQTVRYQNSLRGGLTVATNGLLLDDSPVTYVNSSGGTTMSSYSDLILPAGSSIVKAILYAEGYSDPINSIKFKMAGSSTYTTLTNASAGFIGNPSTGSYSQFIIDVTNMIPQNGYVSTVTSGGNAANTGRYAVADLSPVDAGNHGYGWSLFVVYANAISKYRNVTIVDANKNFGSGTTTTFTVSNITVPSSGSVNAIVAVTGCWGDAGSLFTDNVKFGKSGTTLTSLTDPATAQNTDIMNSTIGFAVPSNVTIDGVAGMVNGNYLARNPFNGFTVSGTSSGNSLFYDCDVMNASGILAPSATPINVAFSQTGSSFDALGSGTYGISIDLAPAVLTKSISPQSICDGGTAVYTFTIANIESGSISLSNIGFTDNLPSGIKIANPSGATITGGSGGVLTAAVGSGSISLSGFSLGSGQTATITVNVTNVPGQLNPSCASNPTAFTNSFLNIAGNTANLANAITPQCLIVYPIPTVAVTNATICSGSSVTLSASGATSYTWNTGANTSSVSVSPTTTTVYTVTGSDNGCSNTQTVSVSVSSIPTTTATTSGSLTCSALSVSLNSSTTGLSYTWTPPPGGILVSPNSQNTAASGAAGIYTLNVQNALGCTYSTTTSVIQNTTTPIAIAATSGTLTCSMLAVNINATTTTTPVSYNWSGTGIISGSGTATITVNQPGTFNYTVTNTSNECITTGSQTVVQNTLAPSVSAVNSGTLTCTNLSVNAGATTTTTPVSYNWTGAGITAGSGTGTITVNQPGTFNYTVTNTSNGCIATGSQVVTQNTIVPTLTVSGTQTITCAASTVTLTGSATPSTCTPVWAGGVVSGVNSYTATAGSANIYTLTVTDPANGCINSATTQVVTSAGIPNIITSVTDTLSCITLTSQVVATTTTTPVSYNWSGAGITAGSGTGTITVNQAGTFNYTVTNTSNGCVTTGSQAVTQNTTVPTVTVSGTQTITCAAPTVTLIGSATPSTCTPVWTGGVVSGVNSYTATATSANIYTLTVTNPDNGCVSSATTEVVSSSGIPVVIASVTNSLSCTTLTTQVIASTTTTPVSYNWSGTGIIAGASTANITVNQPGTFSYTVTNTSNGCSAMGSQVVGQNTTVPTLTVSGTQTITCGAPSVTLIGSATPSICTPVWTGGVTSGANSYTATAASANIYTLTVTDPDNGCVNSATTQVVPSVGMPSVSTSVTNSLSCTLTSAQVIATTTMTPVSYNWTGPNITAGATTPTATVNGAGTYTVVVTNTSTACSSTVTIGVTQNTVSPVVNTNTSGVLNCILTTVNVIGTTTSTPVSYNWSGVGITSPTNNNTITVDQPGTFNYTVTNTDNGCITLGSQAVSQNTAAPTITVSATNPTICPLGSSTLTAGGATSYTWSSAATLSSANGAIVISTPAVTETYTVIGTVGTCTNSAQVTVNVASNPTITVLSNTIICSGTSATLSASGANTYTWSPAVNLSASIGANVNANPSNTQIYTVSGTSIFGCNSSTTVTVTVISNPTITASANPTIICDGSGTTLNANGASSYTWTPVINVANPNASTISASPVITTVYTVTGTNGTAPYLCSSTKTVLVNVQPKTVAQTFTADPICYRSSTTIYAHGGNSYTWTPLSGGVEDQFDSVTIVKPQVTTIYTVTVSKNGLCPGTATVEVVVNPLPIVYAGSDTTININESVLLQGTGNVAVGFLSTDTNPLNCNLCPSIIVQPQDNTCYLLQGTNRFGCTSFDEVCVTVTKDYGVYIPNAFTPNGDGLNELFIPAGYAIAEVDLYIFDRWGKEIFKSDDTHPGWDGTYNGLLCKQDIYVYKAEIISMSGKTIIKVGHVTLLPKLK